MVVNTKYLLSV